MEAAMAKMYASDIALEVTNSAMQIFGGTGFLKGMDVERMYRDAKITTIYEGTNEIQRVVIASNLIGRMPKDSKGGGGRSAAKKPAPITGVRKGHMFREGGAKERVDALGASPSAAARGRGEIRPLPRQSVLFLQAKALAAKRT